MTINQSLSMASPPDPDSLYINLMLINRVANYYCIFAHLLYLVLIVFVHDLRKRTLLFINHAVVASLFYPLAMLTFQHVHIPTLANRRLSHVLCSIFEIYWLFGIYIRMYSIVLIALHRYIAVFHIELFKRINDSFIYLTAPIVVSWLASLGLTLLAKYLFNTTYSAFDCLDGHSTNQLNSILYSVFYVIFSLVLPTFVIILIYITINKKLRHIGTKLKTSQPRRASTRRSTLSMRRRRRGQTLFEPSYYSETYLKHTNIRLREIRFANQYVLMCIIVVLTICCISVFSLKGILRNFFVLFFYWRPFFRTCVLLLASMIPILSFYFNPARKKFFKFVRDKIKCLTRSS